MHALYEVNKHEVGYRKIWKRFIGPILDVDPYLIVPSGISELRVLTWLLHLLYEEKLSVLYMNSTRNKQIFVGNFSYTLIMDVILQNYRGTIWNGGQYGLAYPFLIAHPCHIVPPVNCVSLWINLAATCVEWSKSTRSWAQEDKEKVYRVHSGCRPISYCPNKVWLTHFLILYFFDAISWYLTKWNNAYFKVLYAYNQHCCSLIPSTLNL